MAKIYRRTDRIKVKIDDVVITLAPMTIDQKAQVQELSVLGQVKKDLKIAMKAIALSFKFAVKDIAGVTDSEGKPYKLQFENGELTDESVDELYSLDIHPKLIVVCSTLAARVPDNFENLEGVEIIKSEKETSDPNC